MRTVSLDWFWKLQNGTINVGRKTYPVIFKYANYSSLNIKLRKFKNLPAEVLRTAKIFVMERREQILKQVNVKLNYKCVILGTGSYS